MAHVMAALAEFERAGRAAIEVRRAARRRSTRAARRAGGDGLALRLHELVRRRGWQRPLQWPWSWSAYRRRTARLELADYEVF